MSSADVSSVPAGTSTPSEEEQPVVDCGPPSMAVSIAGISTACSKDALVSSAKAMRKALTKE